MLRSSHTLLFRHELMILSKYWLAEEITRSLRWLSSIFEHYIRILSLSRSILENERILPSRISASRQISWRKNLMGRLAWSLWASLRQRAQQILFDWHYYSRQQKLACSFSCSEVEHLSKRGLLIISNPKYYSKKFYFNKKFNRYFQAMGISRDSRHKRRLTGGRMPIHQKKRAFEKARPVSNTKLVNDKARIRRVRVRGGNYKFRALRLKEGNFNWASESVTRKTRILDVVYNASNNELVRTKTLVKNCIVTIDASPFAAWYLNHYGINIGKKTKDANVEVSGKSQRACKRIEERQKDRVIDPKVGELFAQQRLYACISSRPGQSGRADGYILEGKELEFYAKKIESRKK